MKKNTSKGKTIASKASVTSVLKTDHLEKLPSVEIIPGIFTSKWHEILEAEERDMMILQIRDELLSNTMEICYNNYLERQAIDFTVHCTYLALNDIMDCNFATRDPGDPSGIIGSPFWIGDTLPTTLTKDTWSSQSVPIYNEPIPDKSMLAEDIKKTHDEVDMHDDVPAVDEDKLQLQQELQSLMSSEAIRSPTLSEKQLGMKLSGSTLDDFGYKIKSMTSIKFRSEIKSTFTKIISMPKQFLPTTHLDTPTGLGAAAKSSVTKKGSRRTKGDSLVDVSVVIPEVLQPSNFQNTRNLLLINPPRGNKRGGKPKKSMVAPKVATLLRALGEVDRIAASEQLFIDDDVE